MKTKLLLFLFLSAAYCGFAQHEPAFEVLQTWQKKLKSHNEISFDVYHRMKTIGGIDTYSVRGWVAEERVNPGTLFGGHIWFQTNQGVKRIFDGKNFYSHFHSDSPFTSYQAIPQYRYVIEGNVISGAINHYFLEPINFRNLEAALQASSVSEVELNGQKHWKVELSYKDDEEVHNKRRSLYISQADTLLRQVILHADIDDGHQYTFWEFDNIRFPTPGTHLVQQKVKAVKDSFRVQEFVPPPPVETLLLKKDTLAPLFSGHELYSDSLALFSQFKGQVVVLDFFFLHCQPCIQAIPGLVELQEEFRSQGVQFIGVNGTDAERKDALKKMMTAKKVNYPILMVEEQMAPAFYNVRAYPTLYLVGRDGKVVSSHVGYSINTTAELRKEIKKLLK